MEECLWAKFYVPPKHITKQKIAQLGVSFKKVGIRETRLFISSVVIPVIAKL